MVVPVAADICESRMSQRKSCRTWRQTYDVDTSVIASDGDKFTVPAEFENAHFLAGLAVSLKSLVAKLGGTHVYESKALMVIHSAASTRLTMPSDPPVAIYLAKRFNTETRSHDANAHLRNGSRSRQFKHPLCNAFR